MIPGQSAMPLSHGTTIRGLAAGANPGLPFGRFDRMFDLAPCPVLSDQGLQDLASAIIKVDAGAPITELEPTDENSNIPAGYTYFGQFVDHDMSFDPTPLTDQLADVDALIDFRSPALDLDCVYGRGPADQPYLYERDGLRLRVGAALNPTDPPAKVGSKHDILRLPDGTAILGDKRNDENKIVSQIHGALIALHNKVVMKDDLIDAFGGDRSSIRARFNSAATIVRWHYQWVVVHDFLERVVRPGTIATVLNAGGTPRLPNYLNLAADFPYMPIEFAGAAYRLGHSMVRPSYSLNGAVLTRKGGNGIEAGDPTKERIPTFSREAESSENLNGFPGTLPLDWAIDWSFFLDDVAAREGGTTVMVEGKPIPVKIPQPSYRLDAQIVERLADLPEFFDKDVPAKSPLSIAGNLAFRNLKRGQLLRLPSGQAIAGALGEVALGDDIVWGVGSRVPLGNNASQDEIDAAALTARKRQDFRAKWVDGPNGILRSNTPLWYYILREGEYYGDTDRQQDGVAFGGQHLGPVGSQIIAETFVGLLWLDKGSFLHSSRGFAPLAAITGDKPLTLGRLLTYALTP